MEKEQRRPYGVLGRTLGHSYTPVIYRELAGLDYRKFEREPDEVESFIRGDEWEGVNVTIPYKKDVVPYLDVLTPTALRLGNVNTITRLPDGRLQGDNTDYYGLKVLIESFDIDFAGREALVFGGDGGAGSTCMKVLEDMGVRARSVGRTGSLTYDDLAQCPDTELVVNCTPVGMYPKCPESVCDISVLPHLRALVDIVYNPARTGLMMQAKRRGIPSAGGMLMLVAQAEEAVERYTGKRLGMQRILEVTEIINRMEQSICLIGMPGSGKTTVGRELADLLERDFVDTDEEIEKRYGKTPAQLIREEGEEAFRSRETAVLRSICGASRTVISCGGGVVERQENYALLHQNSAIVRIDRDPASLETKNRPLSLEVGLDELLERREDAYQTWADACVANIEDPHTTAVEIADELGYEIKDNQR